MRTWKVVLATLCFIIPIGFAVWNTNGNAVIDGQKYSDGWQPIIFPRLQSADTTESVKCLPYRELITYYIRVASRHANGLMNSDTVYVRLAQSADDSTYVNVSSVGTTLTLTTLGTHAVVFDYLSGSKFTRLEINRMTDSLNVWIKAIIAPANR